MYENGKSVKVDEKTWELLQKLKDKTGIPIKWIIKDSVIKAYKIVKKER